MRQKGYLTAFIIGFAALYLEGLPNEVYNVYLAIGVIGALLAAFKKTTPSISGNIVAMLVSSAVILSLMDIALRFLMVEKLYYRPHEMFVERYGEMPELSRYKKNVTYRGETFGDLAAMYHERGYEEKRQTTFMTDALGFRNNPENLKKPVDFIMLGDSFGSGLGTAQEKIWGTLAAKKLNKNMYNLSFPANGPWHELLNLKLEVEKLDLNKQSVVVWAIFSGNDLDDTIHDELNPTSVSFLKQKKTGLSNYRNRSPVRQLMERLQHSTGAGNQKVTLKTLKNGKEVLFYNNYLLRKTRSYDELRTHQNYPKFTAVFDEMRRFVKSTGLKVLVVNIPSKAEIYDWAIKDAVTNSEETIKQTSFARMLQELSNREEFTFLDLTPTFRQEAKKLFVSRGEILWWRDDSHWNEVGHELAAETLVKSLQNIESSVEKK